MNRRTRIGFLLILLVAAMATLVFVILPVVAGAIYSFAPQPAPVQQSPAPDRLELGDLLIAFHPDDDMPVLPVYGDAQSLVDRAVAQLAEQPGIQADLIRVARVEPRDFPDASLGAPQPGEMYAQVITPGYVIELDYQGKAYVFHGSGERVVAVS